jgi:hypothetical protein
MRNSFRCSFTQVRRTLRTTEDGARRWLQWATARGVLLRGVEAKGGACAHKQWRPLAELTPALTCHGCRLPIENPHGFAHIEYRYRSGESLLRAMSHDVLPSILAIHYLATTLGATMLFGAYPGVDFRVRGQVQVGAEADVLVVLRTGGFILGECKTNARGLTEGELDKLFAAVASQVSCPHPLS